MKRTLVDSDGQDAVLEPLANGRDVYALGRLQDRSRGSIYPLTLQADGRLMFRSIHSGFPSVGGVFKWS